jgi:hypothetical protein
MSQLVLDDQLDVQKVLPPLAGWMRAVRLQDLRPTERILDDRVPQLLLALNGPTFVTIDRGFWRRRLSHPGYCILYFALRKEEQEEIPPLLRRLFRRPEFRTRAVRMGKVARVSKSVVTYWEADKKTELHLPS